MKANADSAALAETLKQAAQKPISQTIEQPKPEQKKPSKGSSVKLIMAIPPDLHKHYDAIAIKRTKETGRGVTVQQIILELMERSR